MRRCFVTLSWFVANLLIVPAAYGQHLRPGYSIPDITLSPDHRFGVTVPQEEYFEYDLKQVAPLEYTVKISDDPRNSLVEVKTGKVLGVINADTGWDHMGHGEVLPTLWSPDESLLLWEVSGEWCPVALVLLKIQDGAVKWQIDLLKTAQKAILVRTRKAQPQKYVAAMKENSGSGAYFPDGFTVDVSAGNDADQVTLPLTVHADLTSNCKHINTWPDEAELDAELDATVDRSGHFVVNKFRLLPHPAPWD
jgi:hypothetical protein